jgi:hypothetical protein
MKARVPLLSLIAACTVWGCAAEPVAPPPRPEPPPLPDTNVYFYPTAGRTVSAEQQERDKYECNEWAMQQTGFDPRRRDWSGKPQIFAARSAHASKRAAIA